VNGADRFVLLTPEASHKNCSGKEPNT